jgi:hypothetical protein
MAQIASPRRKPKADNPAAQVSAIDDPKSVSVDEYLKAVAREKGRTLKDRERKAAVTTWNNAKKAEIQNSDSLEAQNARAAAAEKNPEVKSATNTALQSQGFQATGSGGTIVKQPDAGTAENFAATLKGARKQLKDMSAAERIALAKQLALAGINVPLTGVYTDQLLSGYQSIISKAQGAYAANKEFPTVATFLADQQAQQAALKAAGGATGTGGKASSYFDKAIFSDTDAASYINSEVRQFLNRDATPAEVKSLTKQLIDAQKAQPNKVVIDAKGNRTTTQGVNPQGFLDNLIRALPEYVAKQTGKASTAAEAALATAKANGINPTQSQIDTWTARLKNGEDINTINHEIRSVASLGQPDSIKKMMSTGIDLATIYQPYKNYMESILEVPASQISLNDPALRMAIGPDKEMNLYDYQKALRTDPRWQYTQNAKTDVSNSVQKVLQDFGFVG